MTRIGESGGSARRRGRVFSFPLILSVRVTQEICDELALVSAFENTRPSSMARRELLGMIRRYRRNPQFKSWLKSAKGVKDKL